MITSVNLCTIPFLSSTDATRASMSAKQILQSLTCDNTEIPYVIGSDYHYLKQNSKMGLVIAIDDGKILYSNSELIIVHYSNINKIQDYYIPPVKKTHSIFGTKLRFNLTKDQIFKKGDILANYDCFLNGIPSYGYNVFTSYMPFFGLSN
jgi:DNA-directed RNA polymerase beta subunit